MKRENRKIAMENAVWWGAEAVTNIRKKPYRLGRPKYGFYPGPKVPNPIDKLTEKKEKDA